MSTIKLEDVKNMFRTMNKVHRYSLPNERQTRRAISDLVLEGIVFIPTQKHIYKRVDYLDELNAQELESMNRYIDTELKSAIKLIRRVRKLEKFMSNEQIKKLHGELEL